MRPNQRPDSEIKKEGPSKGPQQNIPSAFMQQQASKGGNELIKRKTISQNGGQKVMSGPEASWGPLKGARDCRETHVWYNRWCRNLYGFFFQIFCFLKRKKKCTVRVGLRSSSGVGHFPRWQQGGGDPNEWEYLSLGFRTQLEAWYNVS